MKFNTANSASIQRVVHECLDEANVVHCLVTFARHQLVMPYPKTLVYHSTRTDPMARPLLLEFTEVFKDDEVFWGHLAGGEEELV